MSNNFPTYRNRIKTPIKVMARVTLDLLKSNERKLSSVNVNQFQAPPVSPVAVQQIEDGTADGQLLFWDNTAKMWLHTEITEIYWDDTGKILYAFGDIYLAGNNKELRFYEGVNYVGFEAPALTGNQIWVLPDSDGAAGEYLGTDGAGNLDWYPSSGGTPSDTVEDETTWEIVPAAGTSDEYARGDHTHGTPAEPATVVKSGETTVAVNSRVEIDLGAITGDAQDYIDNGAVSIISGGTKVRHLNSNPMARTCYIDYWYKDGSDHLQMVIVNESTVNVKVIAWYRN